MNKKVVFVDTSVFISALLSHTGGSAYILNILHDKISFCINEYVFEELNRIIQNKFSHLSLDSKLFLLLGIAEVKVLRNPTLHSISSIGKLISKEDAPVLAGALESSDYLVTLDNEFFHTDIVSYCKEKNLKIVKPKDLIQNF